MSAKMQVSDKEEENSGIRLKTKRKILKEKSKENKNEKSGIGIWFIQVFLITFVLSLVFSYISTVGMEKLSVFPAVIMLFVVILLGVLFDIVGVAVTVANEHEFHAKATKKVKGSKNSIILIKNASKVANICADVIGDICGVLSGAISALITMKIASQFALSFNIQFLMSALVAAITVCGKAVGKDVANKFSTPIVHTVGVILNKFEKKSKE